MKAKYFTGQHVYPHPSFTFREQGKHKGPMATTNATEVRSACELWASLQLLDDGDDGGQGGRQAVVGGRIVMALVRACVWELFALSAATAAAVVVLVLVLLLLVLLPSLAVVVVGP